MKLLSLLASILFLSTATWANNPFKNMEDLKHSLGFSRFYSEQNAGRRLKIAVLDKGFHGYEKELGRSLPAKTKYIAGPIAAPEELKVEHGLRMAQILTSLLTDDLRAKQWIPELSLYNVYGFSNFQSAITDIIAKKFDLVLYSEVWEYGGNFDGTGFINREVNRATRNGIIWINAAGNFAQTTYNSQVDTLADDWVRLPDQNNALAIRCENYSGKCPVKIVLSWNDFKNDSELGTNKDLDFALTDDLLNIVQSSALKQSSDRKESRPGYSKYSREIIAAELNPGLYFIRIKNRSKNFSTRDQLRITVDGDNIIMPSHSNGETILNPADNNSVITVGASDSERSAESRSLSKPDLLAPSSITLSNGSEFRGSSNSAAIVAAGFGLLKSQRPRMTTKDLLGSMNGSQYDWERPGLSINILRFWPTGSNCFMDAYIDPMPNYLRDAVSKGGVAVQTTAAIRIMVPYDPITMANYLRRYQFDDMIVALPQGGYAVYPRNAIIPNGAVEIFQRPFEAGLCRPPVRDTYKKHFHL